MSLKYEHGRPSGWDEGAKAFSARWSDTHPPKFLLTGLCPRCHHPIALDLSDRKGAGLGGNTEPLLVLVKCNCSEAHPGSPPGSSGCGAEGTVLIG